MSIARRLYGGMSFVGHSPSLFNLQAALGIGVRCRSNPDRRLGRRQRSDVSVYGLYRGQYRPTAGGVLICCACCCAGAGRFWRSASVGGLWPGSPRPLGRPSRRLLPCRKSPGPSMLRANYHPSLATRRVAASARLGRYPAIDPDVLYGIFQPSNRDRASC